LGIDAPGDAADRFGQSRRSPRVIQLVTVRVKEVGVLRRGALAAGELGSWGADCCDAMRQAAGIPGNPQYPIRKETGTCFRSVKAGNFE
jgi:hypothetical protein